jgi:putative ATP-binding cassette transporter
MSQAPAGRQPAEANEGVFAQLSPLLHALGASPCRRRISLLAAGIVAVVCANALGQIRLNAWQGAFFDGIERRDIALFADQLLIFAVIVVALLALIVAQTWLQELIKVRLREWLTHDLLEQWLMPNRAHHLTFAGEIGVNPDQRIHEDTRHLTDLSASLGVGLLQSSLLLVSFVGVLWLLSAQVVFSIGGRSLAIPGYMVWCALGYSLGGSWLAWRIGRPLIGLNTERYAREAELRFALVRVNESAEGIAMYGGEVDERRMLEGTVDGVVTVMRRLAGGLARLTWITSGYGWLAIAAPILVAAPGYFGGDLSFGSLMMVVGAFNQVQQSMRWFVDNFPHIADWRATLLRVATFRDALQAVETLGEDVGRIEVVDNWASSLAVENLSVALADGCAVLDVARFEAAAGEHVSLLGEAGSGRGTLLRAMAGLWPWGTGAVHLPPREMMMFMPQRPYLPRGTLRGAMCYPAASGFCDETTVRTALERLDLDRFIAALDREERWDKTLSLEEQQRLAFVRLLLHAPRWVLIDDAMGALVAEHRRLVLSLFERELAGTAVVGVDRSRPSEGFYSRVLHVARVPGPCLRIHARPRRRRRVSTVSVVAAATGRSSVPATWLHRTSKR